MHNNIDIIPDKLGITLGIRYTHDKKTFTGTQRDENAFGLQLLQLPPAAVLPVPSDLYLLYPPGENRLSFNNVRSEEHTSELQSLMRISYAVFCLKKKKQPQSHTLLQNIPPSIRTIHMMHMTANQLYIKHYYT